MATSTRQGRKLPSYICEDGITIEEYKPDLEEMEGTEVTEQAYIVSDEEPPKEDLTYAAAQRSMKVTKENTKRFGMHNVITCQGCHAMKIGWKPVVGHSAECRKNNGSFDGIRTTRRQGQSGQSRQKGMK